MTIWSGAAAFVVAALAFSATAAADDYESLIDLDLPVIAGEVPVHYSPSAEPEARIYAETFRRAVPWLRTTLGWDGEIVMAVLDKEDYGLSATDPHSIPYAETSGSDRLVVMPDRIDSFPGFDRWDIDAITRAVVGEVFLIEGRGCFVAPASHARLVWTGE